MKSSLNHFSACVCTALPASFLSFVTVRHPIPSVPTLKSTHPLWQVLGCQHVIIHLTDVILDKASCQQNLAELCMRQRESKMLLFAIIPKMKILNSDIY